jgi:hypothetical protein
MLLVIRDSFLWFFLFPPLFIRFLLSPSGWVGCEGLTLTGEGGVSPHLSRLALSLFVYSLLLRLL